MDAEILRAGLGYCCFAFIDDVMVHSTNPDDHTRDVGLVMAMLERVQLRAHPDKTTIASSVVEYLGHNVSAYGLTPCAAKVLAIRELKAPRDVSELRSVLGFMGYYRGYLPHYSTVAKPMNDLLSKFVVWDWGLEQEAAFQQLKDELCREGAAQRRLDKNLPIKVYTDWSKNGIGAVLGQEGEDGKEYMCICLSRSLNIHERNYSPYQGEMLAAVWAIKTLRPYLMGVEFTLVTDHQPLTWLMGNPNLTGQYARWALALQEYDFKVIHRPGLKHANADALSRLPRDDDTDITGARLDLDSDPPCRLPEVIFGTKEEEREYWIQQGAQRAERAWLGPSAKPSAASVLHAMMTCEPRFSTVGPTVDEGCVWSFEERGGVRFDAEGAVRWGDVVEIRDPTDTQLAAMRWVRAAFPTMPVAPMQADPLPGGFDPRALPLESLVGMWEDGVTLYEPFGGLCAGLEMVLRAGMKVNQYRYSDTNVDARAVAEHRLVALHHKYPWQFERAAFERAFALPSDIHQVDVGVLMEEMRHASEYWVVVAGWECQDLSPAGSGRGLQGKRSGTFYPLLGVLTTLQELLPSGKFGFVAENTAMQYNDRHPHLISDFWEINDSLGEPVVMDAAQFGSYAHRLRNFWTNLAHTGMLGDVLSRAKRGPGRMVDDILDEGCVAQVAGYREMRQGYPCNTPGEPICVLPTLMATQGSWAFREQGPGLIWDPKEAQGPGQGWREPNPDERERALGYETGSTAALGVTRAARHRITGGCMDAFCMDALMSGILAVRGRRVMGPAVLAARESGVAPFRPHAVFSLLGKAPDGEEEEVLAAVAEACDGGKSGRGRLLDAWEDPNTLHYLQHRKHLPGVSDTDQRRAQRQAKLYSYDGSTLQRIMADGTRRQVPKPDVREGLVREMHEQAGHFGRRRTLNLVLTAFWWKGLVQSVERVLSTCAVCDRVRSAFNVISPALHPLPVEGLFYRWGVDLCGPFTRSARGNTYVMVCIEHYSKLIELIPLPDKNSLTTSAAFRQHVLGRYGACAEVLTDNGREFEGAFADMLRVALIDHRHTSPNHPQADGLAERAVQTTKRAVRKYVEADRRNDLWDNHLPYIMLGYNCSEQESTGVSPFYMMHAQQPTVPPAIRERLRGPAVEGVETDLDEILVRAEAVKRAGVMAGESLKIAQHRDTLRYDMIRSGVFRPRRNRFEPGDYVYVRRRTDKNGPTLDINARPAILRVVELTDKGVLDLIGACGGRKKVHMSNCAPCHLANIDGTIDHRRAAPGPHQACEGCGEADEDGSMMLCDSCGAGWHCACLDPPLGQPLDGAWQCAECVAQGREMPAGDEPEVLPVEPLRPSEMRKNTEMAALHGRFVTCVFEGTEYWGVVRYRGLSKDPQFFRLYYCDGDHGETSDKKGLKQFLLPEGTEWAGAGPQPVIPAWNVEDTIPEKPELVAPRVSGRRRVQRKSWEG